MALVSGDPATTETSTEMNADGLNQKMDALQGEIDRIGKVASEIAKIAKQTKPAGA